MKAFKKFFRLPRCSLLVTSILLVLAGLFGQNLYAQTLTFDTTAINEYQLTITPSWSWQYGTNQIYVEVDGKNIDKGWYTGFNNIFSYSSDFTLALTNKYWAENLPGKHSMRVASKSYVTRSITELANVEINVITEATKAEAAKVLNTPNSNLNNTSASSSNTSSNLNPYEQPGNSSVSTPNSTPKDTINVNGPSASTTADGGQAQTPAKEYQYGISPSKVTMIIGASIINKLAFLYFIYWILITMAAIGDWILGCDYWLPKATFGKRKLAGEDGEKEIVRALFWGLFAGSLYFSGAYMYISYLIINIFVMFSDAVQQAMGMTI